MSSGVDVNGGRALVREDLIPNGQSKFVVPEWCGPAQDRFGFRVYRRNGDFCSVVRFNFREKGYIVFGRDPGVCDLFVGNSSVSRQQAAAVWFNQNNVCYLIDLESEAGTRVDGVVLTPNIPTPIHPGNNLMFGKATRTYVFDDNIDLAERQFASGHTLPPPAPPKRPADQRTTSPRPHRMARVDVPLIDMNAAKTGDAAERVPVDASSTHVRHILVKHRNSRRPSSAREAVITRSEEEAVQRLRQLRERIVRGEDFGSVAQRESDCSSAKNGGDLGRQARGRSLPAFEAVSFSLRPGELSDIVQTDSGYHIIHRLS